MKYKLDDYRQAPSGIGPLANEWKDKPHRLIYDLVAFIERLPRTKDGYPIVVETGTIEDRQE